MQALAIVAMSILAAVAYGIVHDQITARICVEYFTIGHPRIIDTSSPTLLGLAWGVVATWWMGLALGALLATTARVGRRPRRSACSLVRPILVLLGVMAGIATLVGIVGYLAATSGLVVLAEPLASRVPRDAHVRFLIDGWSHAASYLSGAVGGIVLMITTWRSRKVA